MRTRVAKIPRPSTSQPPLSPRSPPGRVRPRMPRFQRPRIRRRRQVHRSLPLQCRYCLFPPVVWTRGRGLRTGRKPMMAGRDGENDVGGITRRHAIGMLAQPAAPRPDPSRPEKAFAAYSNSPPCESQLRRPLYPHLALMVRPHDRSSTRWPIFTRTCSRISPRSTPSTATT